MPVSILVEDAPHELVVLYRPVFRSVTGEIHALAVDGVDDRVVEAVCRQAVVWEWAGVRPHIALHVSSAQLRRPDFADALRDCVRRALLDPSWFTVEIVESAVTTGDDDMRAVLGRLHDHGFRIAVVDFGGGYSSLARLHDHSVDELKIDQGRAGALEMESLGERVDSQSGLDCLVSRQGALAQGFRVAEPLTAERATLLLRRTPREAPVDRRCEALAAGGR